jgi:hypothetical protein
MKKLLYLLLLTPIIYLASCSKSGITPDSGPIEETIVGKTWKLLGTDFGWFHLNADKTYLTKDFLCDTLEQFGNWELDENILIFKYIDGPIEYVERNTIVEYNDSIVKVQADTSANLDINLIFETTEAVIRGCMDSTFLNFNPNAQCLDTCINTPVYGCMDDFALNYNPLANIDDGSCCYISGCTDATAINYDPDACQDNDSCCYDGDLCIGSNFEGGIIFWLDGNGGGLIAAPSDQSSDAEWGCYQTLIAGADGTAIGTGTQNTIDIINDSCTSSNGSPTAADICANLTLGGYSDWFLPSKDELNEMYLNIGQGNALGLGNIGGFANGSYWSSTKRVNFKFAWIQIFNNGFQGYGWKNDFLLVRAVRAF